LHFDSFILTFCFSYLGYDLTCSSVTKVFFDPAKVGQKKKPPIPKKLGSKAPTPTLPSQRNKSILAESIFGVDITIIEIRSQEEFSTLFAMLLHIATEAMPNRREINRPSTCKKENVLLCHKFVMDEAC